MSKNSDWYLESQPKPSLRKWIFTQMAMGAVYAALAFFGLIAVILVIFAISKILPEDPYAVLDAGSTMITTIA